MNCRVVDRDGATPATLDSELLERELDQGFFWLDLQRPARGDLELLADTLDLHALAVEDSLEFGQRPKYEEYDSFDFTVLYGHAPDADGLVEVHCYVSEHFLVTVRRDAAPGLDDLFDHYAKRRTPPDRAATVFYRVADGLVDSFFPMLTALDESVDATEDAMLSGPTTEQLREVSGLRRQLAEARRVITAQRDLLGRIASGTVDIPGATADDARYFRDVYDHLIALDEFIATVRERIAGAVGVYLSVTSNALGKVSKQLTIVATIFLPLAFITGFFGQNFGWLTDHIGSLGAFLGLGLGIEVLVVAGLILIFKRLDWF